MDARSNCYRSKASSSRPWCSRSIFLWLDRLPMASKCQSVAIFLYDTAVTGPLRVIEVLLIHVTLSVMDLVYIFGLSPCLPLCFSP